MPEDISDIKIFEIVYNKHPNEPMSFIQEEALKMQIAIHRNKLYMKHYIDESAMQVGDGPMSLDAAGGKAKKALMAVEVPDLAQWAINDPEQMKNSVGVDSITCCICGKQMTMMSRHLDSHGISGDEYRRITGLSPETPLMSKGYYAKISARMSSAPADSSAQSRPESPMPDIHTM